MAVNNVPTKFVREYYDIDPETNTKKLSSRWHYDLEKTKYGPVLVENFNLPREKQEIPERKKRVVKKK